MSSTLKTVADEISAVLAKIDRQEAAALSLELLGAKRIFVAGEGRSGLMGKAFAMRLMHGGFTVYAVGETITPSIEDGDLLVAVSGSGATGGTVDLIQKAKKSGAKVVLVTANPDMETGGLVDRRLFIPAATKYRRDHEPPTIQPLGNQFDQSVHLALDSIIIDSMTHKKTSGEEMFKRHSNLE